MFVGNTAPVVRIRREATGVDRYGNPTYGEVETTLAERAAFVPGGSSETATVERVQVVTKPRLYFPHATPDLTVDDKVRVDGVLYTVEGEPQRFRSPFGTGRRITVVELKRAEG